MKQFRLLLLLFAVTPIATSAQEDTTKVNELTVKLQSVNRGEIRNGGYKVEDPEFYDADANPAGKNRISCLAFTVFT